MNQHNSGARDWASVSLTAARWVSADVESSGLDVWRDELIAVGAVAVCSSRVRLGESLEVVLRQAKVSTPDNILVHRISGRDQQTGVDPVEALLAFLEFVGDSPLVGYHAHFDRIMLQRACRKYLGYSINLTWLDLAALAPALVSVEVEADKSHTADRIHPLDWWLERYEINVSARHNAAADALATAQLLGILLAVAEGQGITSVAAVRQCAKDYEWLRGR